MRILAPSTRIAFAAALLAVGSAACRSGRAKDAPPRRFVADPPKVESVEVQLENPKTGEAQVSVRYAADPRLPERLTIAGDRKPIELRATTPRSSESEPRLYTGTTTLDVGALRARQAKLDELAGPRGLDHPVFVGREKVDTVAVPRLDLEALTAGKKVALVPTWVTPQEVDAGSSLFVTDAGVVADPTRTYDPCTGAGAGFGKWSFGYLMQQLAGPNDPAAVTQQWLAQIANATTVNGITVQPRPLITSALLAPWPRTPAGALDLAKAPFRLLAIVNRIDLAENLSYGSGSGGELRFVFGAVKPGSHCLPLRFTVIFEYAVPRSGCPALRDWARAWVDLAGNPVGSSAYNAALQALTEQIVPSGLGVGRPNGSLLAQLRTNEIAFLDLSTNPGTAEWELREFHLDSNGFLAQHTVRRTPRPDDNRTQTVADWVNANASTIVGGQYEVPDVDPTGVPFAGGHARMSSGTFWMGPTPTSIVSADARELFSLNTCSGCHAGETNTTFTHISPLSPVGSPILSGFLTGITVPDPVTPTVTHTFADLDRRKNVLATFANLGCLFHLFHQPLGMAH